MYFIKRGVGSEAVLRSGTFTGVVYGDRAFAEENIAITNVLFHAKRPHLLALALRRAVAHGRPRSRARCSPWR